jgi:pimeloyl-ACP methyl ester carboxylesterase
METRQAAGLAYTAGRWPLADDKSTLVFIHGAGGSAFHWSVQVEALSDVANTLAVDLPAHGGSAGPGRKRVGDYTAAVMELVREIDPPRPVPVGFSMGGAVALELLLDQPDALEAAVLIATGAKLRVMPVILETIERDFDTYVQMRGQVAASASTDPELLRPVLEDAARCDPQVVLEDFRACDAFDVRERLAEIDKPVLVISAEEDVLTPPKFGAYLEQHIAGARRVHIHKAGHLVSVEKADEVNRAIREFLGTLPGA